MVRDFRVFLGYEQRRVDLLMMMQNNLLIITTQSLFAINLAFSVIYNFVVQKNDSEFIFFVSLPSETRYKSYGI